MQHANSDSFECSSLTLLTVFNVCYYSMLCELGMSSQKCTETMNMSGLEPCVVYARQRSRPGQHILDLFFVSSTASGG